MSSRGFQSATGRDAGTSLLPGANLAASGALANTQCTVSWGGAPPCESSKLNPPPSLRSGSRSDVYRQFITKEIISPRLVSYFKLFGRGPGWAAVGRSILEATANQPRWSDRITLRLTSCNDDEVRRCEARLRCPSSLSGEAQLVCLPASSFPVRCEFGHRDNRPDNHAPAFADAAH